MKVDCVFLDFGPLGTEFRKLVRRKLEVEDMTVTTTIRGKKCRFLIPSRYVGGTLLYNVQYPQPLDVTTGKTVDIPARYMRAVLDGSFLRSMSESLVSTPRPFVMLRSFLGFLRLPTRVLVVLEDGRLLGMSSGKRAYSYFGSKVADFLKGVGVPLDVEGRECLVITKSDLERVEKGELE